MLLTRMFSISCNRTLNVYFGRLNGTTAGLAYFRVFWSMHSCKPRDCDAASRIFFFRLTKAVSGRFVWSLETAVEVERRV